GPLGPRRFVRPGGADPHGASGGRQPAPGPRPMKVLVTGAAGFLGSHLVEALVGAGARVTAFDRRPVDLDLPDVVTHEGELGDPAALAAAVAGQDVVFHLAGLADLDAARSRPLATVEDNIVGTVRLLEAMGQAGVAR